MSGYKYIDPTEYGYNKVNFRRKQHNKLFPNNKCARFTHYDYYIGDDKLIIHRTISLSWIVIVTVCLPFLMVLEALKTFKNVLREYCELYNQKRAGRFSKNHVWAKTEAYKEAVVMLGGTL